jgi:hypothetical protein
MEEELKHIDLIDKHLSGTLKGSEAIAFQELLKNDPAFKQEITLYKHIYERIEIEGRANLKKRINTYYEAYLNEKQFKKKGLYRKLIFISSMAAVIVFGIFVFNKSEFMHPEKIPDQTKPTVVDSDTKDSIIDGTVGKRSVEEEAIAYEEIKDSVSSIEKIEYNTTELAIGGAQKLPTELIRTVDFPIQLQYTFDGKEIILFGNPSIASLQIQLLKDHLANYFLKYQNQYFDIDKTIQMKPLKPRDKKYSSSIPTDEEIIVKLKSIDEISSLSKYLEVYLIGDAGADRTYFFEEKEGLKHLIIHGKVAVHETKIYCIKETEKSTYFLRIGKTLYSLDPNVLKPTPLTETYILSNKMTQLFRDERQLLPKQVYEIK